MKRAHGKGSVTRIGDRWRARGPLREDGTRESLGIFATKAEALRAIAAAAVLDADRPTGLTLAAWGERWFASREVRGLAKERAAWRTHVASHALSERLLRRIARPDVEAWVRDVQRSHAVQARTYGRGKTKRVELTKTGRLVARQTAQHALRILRACIDAAVAAGVASSNPAAAVRLRRENSAHRASHELVDGVEVGWTWMTVPEIDLLLSVEPRHDTDSERSHLARCRSIWIVAIFVGLRPGELWGLRWCDVRLDGAHPCIQVRRSYKGPPKTARGVRDVPLLPVVVEALRAWQRLAPGIGERLVWASDDEAQSCHAEGYDAGLRTYLSVAGITRAGLTMRSLRHTCASHLVQGSWTARPLRLEEVQRWMGHSSITVTQRYAHLAPGGLRDLVHGAVGASIGQSMPKHDLTLRKR